MASTYLQPPSPRRRATAIALTVAIHVLLLLVLLNLAPDSVKRPFTRAFSTFTITPEGGEAQRTPVPRPQRQRERQQAAKASPPRPVPPTPPEVQVPDYLKLTRDQFAATDLARLPKSAAHGQADDQRGTATALADSSSAYGPGSGPGGARLYNAEWVRKPTRAELAGYLSFALPAGSWGDVACRSAPGNRVENCQLLGETPGSRLATGMRRAAWQFLIRPPRIGGKPMIGEWILIHFVITDDGLDTER